MGKHVVTGIGPDGRSTVISQAPRVLVSAASQGIDVSDIEHPEDNSEMLMANLYQIQSSGDVARSANGAHLGTGVPPGGLLWIEMKYAGSFVYDLHRTDTIDMHCVLSGEVELLLENGSVHLSAGDTVVVPGILHAWRSEQGWSSNLVVIGLAPA